MIKRLLSHPRGDWLALAIGLIVALPALGVGLFNDDLIHRAHMDGSWPSDGRSPLLTLFAFVVDDPVQRAAQDQLGILPWWSRPDFLVAFLRPLSSATHMLDHALWPSSGVLQHLHSLLWWSLCLLGARQVLRRLHGPGALLALALLLFAVDDAHLLPIGWVANRNALVAMGVGFFTFDRWLAWRARGGLGRLAGVAALLALTLAAGEAGVGVVMWMLAWALTESGATWRERARGLAVPLSLFVLWRVIYDRLGFGVHGSGLYIDPGRDPVPYLMAALERGPVLVVCQLLSVPVEGLVLATPAQRVGVAMVSWGVSLAALRWIWPLLREDRVARFHALGLALALAPAAATAPMARLLTFASVNGAALLASMVRHRGWLEPGPEPAPTRDRCLGGLLILNGPIAALGLVATLIAAPVNLPKLNASLFGHRAGRPGPELLIQVTGEPMMTPYMLLGMVTPEEKPGAVAVLAPWTQPVLVTREDQFTLVVCVEQGFLRAPKEQLFGGFREPFRVGDVIARPQFTATVRAALPDGDPTVVAFVFNRSLDDPSVEIEAWQDDGFKPLALEVGETRRLTSVLGEP